MAKFNYLITCAGWEDRFLDGLKSNIKSHDFTKIIVLRVNEFTENTKANLSKLRELLSDDGFQEIEIFLLDDAKTWKILDALFSDLAISNKSLCIDITTMPRFLIWFVMHFSEYYKNNTAYVYFQPERYEKCEWLTSDTEEPRLVFKHSGIFLPDQPTVLIIQTGFDIERVNQLIYSYEPNKVYLGAQVGEQFNNAIENLRKHKEHLQYQEIEYFEIDAFKGDYGYASMERIILDNKNTHNIIVSSFGPKPASLAMFKLNQEYPEIGLSYVLVKNYNDCYSHGTDVENVISIGLNDL